MYPIKSNHFGSNQFEWKGDINQVEKEISIKMKVTFQGTH